MQKYVEVDMSNFADIIEACKSVHFLVESDYEIILVQTIGDINCYGIHLKKREG